ncbi:large ribosomal subunit protein mL48-like isoform X2 [Branchiostoma floridae x Branchiostoma japonicum]
MLKAIFCKGLAQPSSARLCQKCWGEQVLPEVALVQSRGLRSREGALPQAGRRFRLPQYTKVEVEPVYPEGTIHEELLVSMKAYDMCSVEHYLQFLHRLAKKWNIKVLESYALPTRKIDIRHLETASRLKTFSEATLSLHERVLKLKNVTSTQVPLLLEVLRSHQPVGLTLAVKEPTEDDEMVRFKKNKELEELLETQSQIRR